MGRIPLQGGTPVSASGARTSKSPASAIGTAASSVTPKDIPARHEAGKSAPRASVVYSLTSKSGTKPPELEVGGQSKRAVGAIVGGEWERPVVLWSARDVYGLLQGAHLCPGETGWTVFWDGWRKSTEVSASLRGAQKGHVVKMGKRKGRGPGGWELPLSVNIEKWPRTPNGALRGPPRRGAGRSTRL